MSAIQFWVQLLKVAKVINSKRWGEESQQQQAHCEHAEITRIKALVETHIAPAEKEEEDLPKYCQDHSIYTRFYSDSGFLGIADVIDQLEGEIFKLPGVSELWNKNFLVRERPEILTRMECPVNLFDYSTNLIRSVQVERDHGEYMRRSGLDGFVKLPWLLGSMDDDLVWDLIQNWDETTSSTRILGVEVKLSPNFIEDIFQLKEGPAQVEKRAVGFKPQTFIGKKFNKNGWGQTPDSLFGPHYRIIIEYLLRTHAGVWEARKTLYGEAAIPGGAGHRARNHPTTQGRGLARSSTVLREPESRPGSGHVSPNYQGAMDHLATSAGGEREALATADDLVNIDTDSDSDGPPPLPQKSPKKKGEERVVRSDSGEDEQGPSSAPWSRQEVPGSRTYQVSTAELDPKATLRTEATRQILVEGGATEGLDVFDSRIQERTAQLVRGLPAPLGADKETGGCAPVQRKGGWATAQQTGASAPVQKQEGLAPRMRGQLSSPPAAVRDASRKRTREEEDTRPVSAPPSLGSDGSPSGSQSAPSGGIAGRTRTRRRLNDGQVALQLQAIIEENPTIRLLVPLVEPTSPGIECNRAFMEEEVDRIHNLRTGLCGPSPGQKMQLL
ncbi:unnamed protein product [Calypogeia fissa]